MYLLLIYSSCGSSQEAFCKKGPVKHRDVAGDEFKAKVLGGGVLSLREEHRLFLRGVNEALK